MFCIHLLRLSWMGLWCCACRSQQISRFMASGLPPWRKIWVSLLWVSRPAMLFGSSDGSVQAGALSVFPEEERSGQTYTVVFDFHRHGRLAFLAFQLRAFRIRHRFCSRSQWQCGAQRCAGKVAVRSGHALVPQPVVATVAMQEPGPPRDPPRDPPQSLL